MKLEYCTETVGVGAGNARASEVAENAEVGALAIFAELDHSVTAASYM